MRLFHFFRTNTARVPATWVAGALWCGVIALAYYHFGSRGLSLRDILYELFVFLSTDPRAPLLYILAYTLQPFAFMPSTVFTVLAGSIFGFWPALFYTLIGANTSATAVYWTGRALAAPAPGLITRLGSWITPLQRAPFLTMLFMRLAYFPFDVVNIVSGIIKLRYVPFALGTALGSVPGIATLTALGTSLDLNTFLTSGVTTAAIDLRLALLSLGLFVVSVLIAEAVRRLQKYWLAPKPE
jgi:uncharacterized membrane protein YdjX (TVP38/TMEM64 family)